jgi:hypothetical protein
MNTIPFPKPDEASDRARVAAEVRAQLARRNIKTYKLPEYLDGGRSYWQRRASGELALDIDDLSKLADLLGVSIVDFIPGGKPAPWAPSGSNRRPTDYRGAGTEVASLDDRRARKALA